MTGIEICVAIAGAIGLADIIRIIIEKFFSKKSDDFARLKERLEFTEKETTRLNKVITRTNMKVLRLYTMVTELVKKSCGKNCPMREIVDIDLESLNDIDENSDENDLTDPEINEQ